MQTTIVAIECEYLFWEVVHKVVHSAIEGNNKDVVRVEYLANLVCKSPGGRYFDRAVVVQKIKALTDNGE